LRGFVFVGFDDADIVLGYEVWGSGVISASEVPAMLIFLKKRKTRQLHKVIIFEANEYTRVEKQIYHRFLSQASCQSIYMYHYHLNRATHAADLTSATR
jgi:hypothetical protein